jgi:hypothetical protein
MDLLFHDHVINSIIIASDPVSVGYDRRSRWLQEQVCRTNGKPSPKNNIMIAKD